MKKTRQEYHRLIDGTLLKQQFQWSEKAYLSIDEIIKWIDETPTYDKAIVEVEINEIHTFAKPEDVSKIDFPGTCREDK